MNKKLFSDTLISGKLYKLTKHTRFAIPENYPIDNSIGPDGVLKKNEFVMYLGVCNGHEHPTGCPFQFLYGKIFIYKSRWELDSRQPMKLIK